MREVRESPEDIWGGEVRGDSTVAAGRMKVVWILDKFHRPRDLVIFQIRSLGKKEGSMMILKTQPVQLNKGAGKGGL